MMTKLWKCRCKAYMVTHEELLHVKIPLNEIFCPKCKTPYNKFFPVDAPIPAIKCPRCKTNDLTDPTDAICGICRNTFKVLAEIQHEN